MNRVLQILLFLIFAKFSVSFAGDETSSQVSESETRSVRLISGGWWLSMRPEGSGSIFFGAGGDNFAFIPKDTFDFEKFLAEALPCLSDERREAGDVEVFVYPNTKPSQIIHRAKYLDAKIAEPIFERALRKCESLDPSRIKLLARERPVFKGELWKKVGDEIDPTMKTQGIMPDFTERFKANPSSENAVKE